ncbi:MAG: hypothetical protein R6W70_03150 [bacterium]
MLKVAVEQANYDILKEELELWKSCWSDLQSVRKCSLPQKYGKMLDLMHLLLAYNVPGLPGYVPQGDVPGTDIHSLHQREVLMRKHFPFSEKRGLVNRFLKREKPFFKMVALSLNYPKPLFFFMLDKKEGESKLDVFREKISSITDWFKILFKTEVSYVFTDLRNGRAFFQKDDYDFPVFTKDIFLFCYLTDFITAGIPYFLYSERGLRYDEIHKSWKPQLKRLTSEIKFFFTDLNSQLPSGNTETIFMVVLKWFKKHGIRTLSESFIATSLILMELEHPGFFRDNLRELKNEHTLFYTPSLFFFHLMNEHYDYEKNKLDRDSVERMFYLSLREKPAVTNEGMERILSNDKLKSLEKYCEEPLFYTPGEFKKLNSSHRYFLNVLYENVNELSKYNIPEIKEICNRLRKKYDFEGNYITDYNLFGGLSRLRYENIKIIYREGLEKEWELLLETGSESDIFYRGRSLEEILLFMILNKISWPRGISIENVSTSVISETERLRKGIEQWLKSDEIIFISLNYSERTGQPDFLYNADLIDNIKNREKKQIEPEIRGESTVFIKAALTGQISTHHFSGNNIVSCILSLLASRQFGADELRVMQIKGSSYRPVAINFDQIVINSPKPPLVFCENTKINLITDEEVYPCDTIYEVFKISGDLKLKNLSFVEISDEINLFAEIYEKISGRGVEIFNIRKNRTILVFLNGIFTDSFEVENNKDAKDLMTSFFSFTESISVNTEKDIDVKTMEVVWKSKNTAEIKDTTSVNEFDSTKKRGRVSKLHVFNDRTFILSFSDESKVSAATVEELMTSAERIENPPDRVINYCAGELRNTYSPEELIKIKIKIEKQLAKMVKA